MTTEALVPSGFRQLTVLTTYTAMTGAKKHRIALEQEGQKIVARVGDTELETKFQDSAEAVAGVIDFLEKDTGEKVTYFTRSVIESWTSLPPETM
jgi:hypothetical protein